MRRVQSISAVCEQRIVCLTGTGMFVAACNDGRKGCLSAWPAPTKGVLANAFILTVRHMCRTSCVATPSRGRTPACLRVFAAKRLLSYAVCLVTCRHTQVTEIWNSSRCEFGCTDALFLLKHHPHPDDRFNLSNALRTLEAREASSCSYSATVI